MAHFQEPRLVKAIIDKKKIHQCIAEAANDPNLHVDVDALLDFVCVEVEDPNTIPAHTVGNSGGNDGGDSGNGGDNGGGSAAAGAKAMEVDDVTSQVLGLSKVVTHFLILIFNFVKIFNF